MMPSISQQSIIFHKKYLGQPSLNSAPTTIIMQSSATTARQQNPQLVLLTLLRTLIT